MHVLTRAELQTVLVETRRGLLEIFGDRLEMLLLFGSYAKGEASPESDIDLFILANIDENDIPSYRRKVSDFTSDIDLEHDVLLNVILRDSVTCRAQDRRNPFLIEILDTGIELLNADIEKVLAEIPVTITIEVNSYIYEEVKAIFASLGYTMEEVCNLFIEKSLACGGFPFPVSEAKLKEYQAIREASDRILEKHRDAFIALGDGFSDDFMESGREQGAPQLRDALWGNRHG